MVHDDYTKTVSSRWVSVGLSFYRATNGRCWILIVRLHSHLQPPARPRSPPTASLLPSPAVSPPSSPPPLSSTALNSELVLKLTTPLPPPIASLLPSLPLVASSLPGPPPLPRDDNLRASAEAHHTLAPSPALAIRLFSPTCSAALPLRSSPPASPPPLSCLPASLSPPFLNLQPLEPP
jgi:hypothetical protein